MKKIFGVCLFALMSFISVSAYALADMSNPYKLASEVATQTVNELKNNRDKLSDKEFARNLVEKDLMPYVDITYASYKVIGTELNKTSKEEREAFTKAFREYMVMSLTDVLSKYVNQEVIADSEKPLAKDATIVPVKFIIREAGKQDLSLVLKLRLNKKTSEWKVFDLIGENISILDAKSSEISPIIKSKGIQAAIEALKNIKPEL